MVEAVAVVKARYFFFNKFFGALRLGGFDTCTENDAFAFLDRHFKVARDEQIFCGVVAAFAFFRIIYSSVPVGAVVPFGFLAELHVQVGISLVQAHLDSVFHLFVATVGYTVFVCPLPYTAEGQEGAQTEGGGRVGVKQCVTDMDSMDGAFKDDFFFQQYAAYAIGPRGNLFPFKTDDVLVTLGAVVLSLVFVQAKVEFCAMLDDGFIKGGQENVVLIIQFGNWNYEQSIVLSDITPYEGR